MKTLLIGIVATALTLLSACGADSEDGNSSQESAQSQQGILSDSQQQALDTARSVEQTLLNSAADREKELEALLRTQ